MRKSTKKATICDIQLVLQEGIFQIYCGSRFQAAETINSIAVTIKAEHSSVKAEQSSKKGMNKEKVEQSL